MTVAELIAASRPAEPGVVWTPACRCELLVPGRGVGVLLDNGTQAALFRLEDDSLHAICNIDPFFGAAVLSRGVVGDVSGRLAVASPLKKQHFAFDDGSCLEAPRISVRVFHTRVVDGEVQVGREASRAAGRIRGVITR